jgi:Tfp pilus assembly protein PilN
LARTSDYERSAGDGGVVLGPGRYEKTYRDQRRLKMYIGGGVLLLILIILLIIFLL